jgi:hypothetical protein
MCFGFVVIQADCGHCGVFFLTLFFPYFCLSVNEYSLLWEEVNFLNKAT